MSSAIELSVDEVQEQGVSDSRRNKPMEAIVTALIQPAGPRHLIRAIIRELYRRLEKSTDKSHRHRRLNATRQCLMRADEILSLRDSEAGSDWNVLIYKNPAEAAFDKKVAAIANAWGYGAVLRALSEVVSDESSSVGLLPDDERIDDVRGFLHDSWECYCGGKMLEQNAE